MKEDIVIYPHNKMAYQKVCEAFKTSNRTCVVHPTGTGKMYIALQLIDANVNKNILYLTSYGPILTALETEMKKCGVAADNLVTGLYAGLEEASVERQFDYIILDEFHRAGAEVWGQWISKLLNNNPQAKILGLSATPIRYLDNNRDMSDELFEGNVASYMTLAEAVGTGILKMPKYVCAAYSLSDEIEAYADRISKIKTAGKKTEALALLEKARRSLEQADGLATIFESHITVRDGHYIVFCRNYEHLESMKEECLGWLEGINSKIEMYEVRAAFSPATNQQTLTNFITNKNDSLKLLLAVDMLNEGIHVADIDGCIMLRPTESMNVYLQQLGRAISVSNKSKTVVLDIVNNSLQLSVFGSFCDEVEKFAQGTGSGVDLEGFEIHESLRNFRDIVAQIDILLSNKTWEEWFVIAKRYYDAHGHLRIYEYDTSEEGEKLLQWLTQQRYIHNKGEMPSDRTEKMEGIGMIWDPRAAAWETMFTYAKDYYAEKGDLRIPLLFTTTNGAKLGSWINQQRDNRRKGILAQDRIAKLEAIGMIWSVVRTWDESYELAKNYYNASGHLCIPKRTTKQEDKKIATWIQNQRTHYKKGILSEEQIEKLNAIGMIWRYDKPTWEQMYEYAKEYYYANDDLLIPHTFATPEGYNLGEWIKLQRYNFKKGILSTKRQAMLEAIGMTWSMLDDAWEIMYAQAKAFFEKNGHLDIPKQIDTPDGYNPLYKWVGTQRGLYKRGKLLPERVMRLNAIGIDWDPVDTSWEQMFAYAKEFYDTNGHWQIPMNYTTPNGRKLQDWIHMQRRNLKKGILPKDKKERLDAIALPWAVKLPNDDAWDQNYTYAKEFFQKTGHLTIPPKFTTPYGVNLNAWISAQRQKQKAGTLSAEQQALLGAIGMDWKPLLTWDEMYGYATDYFYENGNLQILSNYVTPNGITLGTWICNQRERYKKKKLTAEQVSKLNAIGMIWSVPNDNWDQMFDCAKAYFKANGSLLIPATYVTPEGQALGDWVHRQRKIFQKGKLDPERIARLESIEMVWAPIKEDQWAKDFSYAKEFFEANGHLRISKKFLTPEGKSLGAWIISQRKAYRSGRLAEDRIAKLETIGIEWTPGK